MFGWFERRRRRRILETPFPDEWRDHLRRNVAHYSLLTEAERRQLEELAQIFIAEKHWEGAGGLELTDEMRVTIAGQACLLILELEHELYRNVETIIVYPATVVPRRAIDPALQPAGVVVRSPMPLLGEAHSRGPVILTWDEVQRGARDQNGHNVVLHELAHKLDMLDGSVDGTPPLASREQYDEWVRVCTESYELLRERSDAGEPTLLDPYGATDVGEFFAVATEVFFDEPLELEAQQPELYAVLRDFYRQDTAERQRRASGGSA